MLKKHKRHSISSPSGGELRVNDRGLKRAMKLRHLRLPLAVLLALGVATGAAAQNKQKKSERAAPTALPILNNANGKVEQNG